MNRRHRAEAAALLFTCLAVTGCGTGGAGAAAAPAPIVGSRPWQPPAASTVVPAGSGGAVVSSPGTGDEALPEGGDDSTGIAPSAGVPGPAAVSPPSATLGAGDPAPTPLPGAASPPATPTARPGPTAPPRLAPLPGDYRTPEAVARAYFAAWCYLPLDGPANQNIANAALWLTAAGFADDKTRVIGLYTWKQIQADRTTTLCGPVRAEDANEGPETDRRRFIGITATRYRIDPAGQVLSTDDVAQLRRVLRAADGRWLVDIQVNAG